MFRFFRVLKAPLMSTHLEIKGRIAKKDLLAAYAIAKDLESRLSAYDSASEISKINHNAGIRAVAVSAESIEVIRRALEIAEMSEGSFDPTIGALSHAGYGFGTKERRLSPQMIKKYRALVDYKKLHIEGNRVFLAQKGMRVDLGGIGKGYAVDKMMEYLLSRGVRQALISLGGEIASVGKKWNLGIGHPRRKGLAFMVMTSKALTAMTTSGDYERNLDSVDLHHILNPDTGSSANRFSSVTLLSETQNVATLDALNTALFNSETLYELLPTLQIKRLSMDKSATIVDNEIDTREIG